MQQAEHDMLQHEESQWVNHPQFYVSLPCKTFDGFDLIEKQCEL